MTGFENYIRDGGFDHITPGTRRGCRYAVGADWPTAMILIERHLPKVYEEFQNVETVDDEGRKFFVILLAAYLGEGRRSDWNGFISFVSHCDRTYFGKGEWRSLWTWLDSVTAADGLPKSTRFSNRDSGEWVSIVTPHGTIIEGSAYAMGADETKEMEHSIYNARGTVTATFDHGRNHVNNLGEEIGGAGVTLTGGNDGDNSDEEGDDDEENDWLPNDGDNSDEEEGEEDHVDDQESIQGELLRAIRHEAEL